MVVRKLVDISILYNAEGHGKFFSYVNNGPRFMSSLNISLGTMVVIMLWIINYT
jgi:hypothetical protein